MSGKLWTSRMTGRLSFIKDSGAACLPAAFLPPWLRVAIISLMISGVFSVPVVAQETATMQDAQLEDALFSVLFAKFNVVTDGVNSVQRAGDPDSAFDSNSGRNFVYDHRKKVWIDAKTGEAVTSANLEDALFQCLFAKFNVVTDGVNSVQRASDPDSAFDSKSGRNFVYDHQKQSWIDAKTGECICPSCAVPQENKSVSVSTPPQAIPQNPDSMSGFTPSFQLRGFGGVTLMSGNAPTTAGFDGAVLFPLGNRVLVGPTAGFQWVGTSIVSTIGGGPPPSTFIDTNVGFKTGNFGGRLGLTLGRWELGVSGGASVASSTITQNEGACNTGSAGIGCTVVSTSTAHDTVVGPCVGGYISHSIFPHVGVYVAGTYRHLKDSNVFKLNSGDIVGGLVFSFGRK